MLVMVISMQYAFISGWRATMMESGTFPFHRWAGWPHGQQCRFRHREGFFPHLGRALAKKHKNAIRGSGDTEQTQFDMHTINQLKGFEETANHGLG
jgi:hypothetical protein